MRAAVAEAIAFQRDLHEHEEEDARRAIEDAGCEVVELEAGQHAAFVAAVQPLLREARGQYGEDLFRLAGKG
jgi:TRAP-type C4-dicarboxylate transport system substrate-binding protein